MRLNKTTISALASLCTLGAIASDGTWVDWLSTNVNEIVAGELSVVPHTFAPATNTLTKVEISFATVARIVSMEKW